MKKAEAKADEELAHAAETLDQITDEWIEQQRDRFENTTTTFRKKWVPDWFSDFYILKFFKDKMYKRRSDDIVDTFRLYIPNIAKSLKEIWNNFVRSVRFMQKVERDKDRAEKSHGLGFWWVNFFNTAAARTVKRLRHIVELTRKYLATQQQTKTLEKRPEGVLNSQVGELLRSSPSHISASEISGILNKRYAAEYESISPCAVGKTKNWKKHLDERKKSLKKMIL